jgi:hypothetical protein
LPPRRAPSCRGTTTTPHNATVIISGETVIFTDDGEQRCGPGEWYQTRAGEMHAIRFDADTVQIELRFDGAPSSED